MPDICYGIPAQIERMVQMMYTCAVVDGEGRTDWFEVRSGVKQGCNMSGFPFLLIIDWTMRSEYMDQVENDVHTGRPGLRR